VLLPRDAPQSSRSQRPSLLPLSTQDDPRPSATAPLPGGYREVGDLAYPVVLTQLSATMMGVVDSAMVGRLGPTELAAVGFGSIWVWTIFSLLYGTASGVQTFVSQADGAARPLECGQWAWQSLYTVLPAAIVFVAVLGPSVGPLLELLGPSEAMREAAAPYLHTRLFGEIAMAMGMVITSFFRGVGDTRTPLYVGLFANALNAVLDYGLIFGELGLPAWGVAGAGAATAIANWIAAIVLFAAFRRRSVSRRFATQAVRPDAREMRRFLRTGAPIGGQWAVDMMAFAVFTTVVARMGDSSMAASQAFVILLSLSFMQAVGISVAASTLVGRYVGAREPESANRSFRTSIHLGVALAVVVAIVFVAIPETLLGIFTDDSSVMALGRPLLVIGALFQLFDSIAIVSSGALRGAGDTRWPFLVQTAFGWGVFVPLAYWLGVVKGGGLTGAWLGGLIYIVLLAAVLYYRFRSGAWSRIEI
jgi:MATE family multidrug resistance protein